MIKLLSILFISILLFGCGSDDSESTTESPNTSSTPSTNTGNNSNSETLYALENTSPDEELSSILYSEADDSYIGFSGRKDSNGNLLNIKKLTLGKLNDNNYITFHFDIFLRITEINFNNSGKIVVDDYTFNTARFNIYDESENLIGVEVISLTSIDNFDIFSEKSNTISLRTDNNNDISNLQKEALSSPTTLTLCRKREGTFKINSPFIADLIPRKRIIRIIEEVADDISYFSSMPSDDVTTLASSLASKAVGMLPGGDGIILAIKSAQCVADSNTPSCIESFITDLSLEKSPVIWEGSINECQESEKINSYLYAVCAGEDSIPRSIKTPDRPTCVIPVGGKIDVGVFYYKPDSILEKELSSELGFAYTGPFGIPNSIEENIYKKKTGWITYEAIHQDSGRSNSGCHSTLDDESQASNKRNSAGSLWGLSISSERPGSFAGIVTDVIQADNYPNVLEFVAMGYNQTQIVGTDVPCYSYMRKK